MIGRQGGGGAIGATAIGARVAFDLLLSPGSLGDIQWTAPAWVGELTGILIWMTDYVAKGVEGGLV